MLTVRALNKEREYDMLVGWWKHWGYPITPKEDLVENGFMACWDGKPILCADLILTHDTFALMENMCASPETSHEDREQAVIIISAAICDTAKSAGVKRLYGITKKDRLIEKLKLCGWEVRSEQVSVCVKEL